MCMCAFCLEDQLMNSSANITQEEKKRHNNIFLKSGANAFLCFVSLSFLLWKGDDWGTGQNQSTEEEI